MARVVGIGHQDFSQVIQNDYFCIDKTKFIKEWWENGDAVTLYTLRWIRLTVCNMLRFLRQRAYRLSGSESMVLHFRESRY